MPKSELISNTVEYPHLRVNRAEEAEEAEEAEGEEIRDVCTYD